MKNKGAVKFFAIALAVVCLFQLSFTFVANTWDKKAEQYAHGDLARKRHFLDSAGRRPVMNLGLYKYTYMDVKERSMNLGLDLRGGMHVTLQVAMNELIKQLSNNSDDPTFNKALTVARERQKTSQKNYIDLFYEAIKEQNPKFRLAPIFATLENRAAGIDPNSNDDKVLAFLRSESQSALDRTYNIISTRIDKFGVTQPNKQKDDNTGRIIVELPGADDPERVRHYLQGSAKLEFYETYTLAEAFPFLKDADKELYDKQMAEKGTKGDTSKTASAKDSSKSIAGIPLAKEAKDTSKNGLKSADKSKIASAKAKTDSLKQKENPLIGPLLGLVGASIQDRANSPIVGYVPIADTPKINKLLAMQVVRDALPPEMRFAWMNKPMDAGKSVIELVALKSTGLAGKEAVLTGDVVTDARKDVDRQSNTYEVSMQMNSEGASQWAQVTKANIGKFVAIVLDNTVYSAPRVNGEISGGRSQITGNFSAKEAGDLANILKAGKLPVRVEIIEEAIVGPSMGQDAINKGFASLLVGLVAIVIFMILYYSRSGWVANIALLVNLFFITGVLASLGAALTLPGMAGILLTLATAVDANVLIYERIRDELAEGKGMKLAISEGFRNAMSSIIDANIVSLLIGIILLTFGQGPVYGFAVVLVIGILTSLFTSILITRIIFEWLLDKDSKINFGGEFANKMLRGINYDFVGKRRTFYILSGAIIGIGIISLAVRGLNYGVDFKGGYSYVVNFDKAPALSEVRNDLTKAFGHMPEVKTYGSDTKLNIITDYMITENGDSVANKVKDKLIAGLAPLGKEYNPKVIGEQKVGATIASDIKNSAFSAILFSLIVIFIYIIVRFKSWQFALGATVAMAHDALFVLTIFSLFKDVMPFSLDVDQSIIAAILTVMVYSMNDTVVVFDRIREYLNNNKKSPMIPTINDAINKTLSRTVITSFTIFLVVLILFIFGGSVIKGFAFAMLVGVIIGTYSSIFVATPIVVDLTKKNPALEPVNPTPARV
jgi:SecD/SecF fusion protein